ncbi:amino acid adenylation domain-containing protein [Anaerolineales bacterium HSG6]|nr:amino acid adenylation domain-containing protein [Anaerolineales bacterium HSG6]
MTNSQSLDNHDLTTEQEQLLALMLAEEGFDEDDSVIITPRLDNSKPAPLSYAQQRLWFLDQLIANKATYNIPLSFHLQGTVDTSALRQALATIEQRHEILRTVIQVDENQQPVQIIQPTSADNHLLTVIDLSSYSESDRLNEAKHRINAEAHTPFDLAQGPLWRTMLFQLTDQTYILLMNLHHIVYDEWSDDILFAELSTLYKAYKTKQDVSLPEPTVQYADYAVWQQSPSQKKILAKKLQYWQKKLVSAPPLLELPIDYPRPATQTFVGTTQTFVLPAKLTKPLKILGLEAGATLFMTLLTAFKILLYRYTHQTDILVGVPVANRDRSEIERLMGFFVNTIVLRTDLSDTPSFQKLLAQVRETTLEAYEQQDVPFEQVVEKLGLERNLSYQPLFQVMFALENNRTLNLNLLDLELDWFEVENRTSKFDLTLTIVENDQQLYGTFEYNYDLFASETIKRMVGHFEILLTGIVTNPNQSITDLPLLTEMERYQLLVEWNDTNSEYPHDKCIHQLFEEQVERTYDNIAIVYPQSTIGNGQFDVELTYRELNQRANQLAHHLQTVGVKPGVCVGICLNRSVDILIAILATLKAGGAYVPLNNDYPSQRLSFMLSDVQAPILLTHQTLYHKFASYTGSIFCLDSDWELVANQTKEKTSSSITSNNLAYIIYTSGSTGQPKGVMIRHNNLVNAYLAWESAYQLRTEFNTHLQMANFSFDVFSGDWIRALCSGGKLVICPYETLLNPQKLYALMTNQQINCADFVPAVFRHLLQYLSETEQKLDFMRILVIASDNWYIGECNKIRQYCNRQTRLVNAYGLTETTIDSTYFDCSILYDGEILKQNLSADRLVPIGRPFTNTQIYILDSSLHLLPIGITGELYIAGDGVSQGYINQPNLTRDRFVDNVFNKNTTSKLYRTGDLARYLPDGNIEFLGRIDHQIKIRGFRIELGEIETILTQYEAIREVIVTQKKIGKAKQLIAYLTLNTPHQTTLHSELRDYLQQKLPSYMIPATFVTLEQFPLTPNGKIDRNALPEIDNIAVISNEYASPKTQTEKIVADIWKEVLNVRQVGRHDNFFELGGHSLLAIQLISKISTAVDIKLSVNFLFLHPTVAEQAEMLQNNQTFLSAPIPASFINNKEIDVNSPHIQIENSPLLPLLAQGEIQPIDAIALGYIPIDVLEAFENDYDKMMSSWFKEPRLNLDTIIETSWGSIALMILPHLESNLYNNQDSLVQDIIDASLLAKQVGAKSVSLTGLIPSATNYGRAILQAIDDPSNLPSISTGHGTTSSAVVLNISRIIKEAGRNLTTERVGFIGLGSIGLTTLRLMLYCLPHPQTIMLCDVYGKTSLLEDCKTELVSEFGFQGEILITPTNTEIPTDFYTATLIVGATNVPDVLDIQQVRPGTLIIDDSAPHCFSVSLAVERFQKQTDILFTEGGVLQPSEVITQTIYCPPKLQQNSIFNAFLEACLFDPTEITGCVFSSLLSACFEVPPTIGIIDAKQAIKHYDLLLELGFQGSRLHCEGYVLPQESVEKFYDQFGDKLD